MEHDQFGYLDVLQLYHTYKDNKIDMLQSLRNTQPCRQASFSFHIAVHAYHSPPILLFPGSPLNKRGLTTLCNDQNPLNTINTKYFVPLADSCPCHNQTDPLPNPHLGLSQALGPVKEYVPYLSLGKPFRGIANWHLSSGFEPMISAN